MLAEDTDALSSSSSTATEGRFRARNTPGIVAYNEASSGIVEWCVLSPDGTALRTRFVHAKALAARVASRDHVFPARTRMYVKLI